MPIRTESWVRATLHPVFRVSLPEGVLRQLLTQKLAPHFDYFGDMELLSVVGAHLVGRINLAFEDMCAMLALNAGDKFSGSVEKIVRKIAEFCPLDQRRAALDQFYAQYLVCMAIRNGDAHLKNFGFVYSSTQDVRLSPVFDMLSMSVYAPRAQDGDALDAPALSFGGVKRWFVKKSLQELADRCFVAPKFQAATSARLVSALLSVAQDVVAQTATHPGFAPTGQRMLELWSYGCQIHSADASQQLKALAASLGRTDPVLQSPG
jgi:serine/threonine-protein kinase HipA